MRLAAEGWQFPWQTLIAIIMSARTRDETTVRVGGLLFRKYPSVGVLSSAKLSDVTRIIRPVNFYRTKAGAIVGCARALRDQFGGVPPRNRDLLLALPGVGRKTANVFLAEFGSAAIGVDTHVSYIARFLGWSRHRKPEQIERNLETLFPRRTWRGINAVCVHFGKRYTSRREKDALLSRIRVL